MIKEVCGNKSPYDESFRCQRPINHNGFHRYSFARWGKKEDDDNLPSLCDYELYRDWDWGLGPLVMVDDPLTRIVTEALMKEIDDEIIGNLKE